LLRTDCVDSMVEESGAVMMAVINLLSLYGGLCGRHGGGKI